VNEKKGKFLYKNSKKCVSSYVENMGTTCLYVVLTTWEL